MQKKPGIVETQNAIYYLDYERSHEGPVGDIVDRFTADALVFEDAGARLPNSEVDKRLQGKARKPTVFLLDLPVTKQQLASSNRRGWGGGLFKALAAIALGREVVRAFGKRRERKGKQPLFPKARAKLRETRFGKAVGKIRQKEDSMNPTRRKFLRWAGIGGAAVLSEAIYPKGLREVPATRKIAERIDILWKDFVIPGRNAATAERLETIVAPLLGKELGRKPAIIVVSGTEHKGIEAQLKDSAFRRKTLETFRNEIGAVSPRPADYINRYKYVPGRGYKGEGIIKAPPLLGQPPKPSAMRRPVRPTRREFFASAARGIRRIRRG